MKKEEKEFIAEVLKQVAEEVWNHDNYRWDEEDAKLMTKLANELEK